MITRQRDDTVITEIFYYQVGSPLEGNIFGVWKLSDGSTSDTQSTSFAYTARLARCARTLFGHWFVYIRIPDVDHSSSRQPAVGRKARICEEFTLQLCRFVPHGRSGRWAGTPGQYLSCHIKPLNWTKVSNCLPYIRGNMSAVHFLILMSTSISCKHVLRLSLLISVILSFHAWSDLHCLTVLISNLHCFSCEKLFKLSQSRLALNHKQH